MQLGMKNEVDVQFLQALLARVICWIQIHSYNWGVQAYFH